MKPDELQELLSFIASSGLEEVNIETDKFKIAVKRSSPQAAPAAMAAAPQAQQSLPAAAPAQAAAQTQATALAPSAQAAPAASSSAKTHIVKSPMIGTFYAASNPETPRFVNVGDTVKVGQTLCIIEAMKLFNEIESDVSGRVVRVLADDKTPVEYDQPLFEVEIG